MFLTLAIASVLHYFDVFTFHTCHYWSCIFLVLVVSAVIKRFTRG